MLPRFGNIQFRCCRIVRTARRLNAYREKFTAREMVFSMT